MNPKIVWHHSPVLSVPLHWIYGVSLSQPVSSSSGTLLHHISSSCSAPAVVEASIPVMPLCWAPLPVGMVIPGSLSWEPFLESSGIKFTRFSVRLVNVPSIRLPGTPGRLSCLTQWGQRIPNTLRTLLAHVLEPKRGNCVIQQERKRLKILYCKGWTQVLPVGSKRKYHEKNYPMGSLYLNF